MPPISLPLYPLSILSAHLLALSFSSSYVGSIYAAKNARIRFTSTPDARQTVQAGSRDDPAVIRARLTVVTFASAFSCAVLYLLVARSTQPSTSPFTRTLDVLGVRWPASVLSCLQTPLLFLEEIVFRACVLSVYNMAGATRWKMIAFAPLVFGLAHVHHAWETYNRFGRTQAALKRAVLSTLFQTLYTTAFGAHTSFLFLRTSSLLPPLTAHVWCNMMGVPQLGSEIRRFPARKTAIQSVYALGILLFAGTLAPWTRRASLYWR
ncbi:hypothetical protein C8R43DRAFT_1036556 [Mycena crocata]|nr:hypothetical protein C8R43DRAFT_1036556 [Mycena crocata]